MTTHEAGMLIKLCWLEYIFLGLFICAIARVDKWTKVPYAILGVMLLWPAWLGMGFIEIYLKYVDERGTQR